MKKISRQQALKKGLAFYFTGKRCIYGHRSKRQTRKSFCYACNNKKAMRWHKRNPERVTQATPPWADKAAIRAMYKKARQRTKTTGVKMEVDHYYPLRGKQVSGLHVEHNLRVVRQRVNRRKWNRLIAA